MADKPPTEDLSRDVLLRAAPRDANGRPVLGQVPLLRLLGKGRMGAVYYGVHPGLQAEVAVRVLPFHVMQTPPDVVEHFMSRTRAAAQVSSPYLVRVLNVNCEHGIHYLVSEYVTGTSAKALVSARQAEGTRGLDEAQALSIMLAVCQGLREAHRQGLTHGDIKPRSILIPETQDGLQLDQAKLADLGISKPADPKASLKVESLLGTPGYIAPEQAMDANAAVPASDVFAMGCTLYTMLSGRRPFVAPTMTATLIKSVSDPHTPLMEARKGVSRPVDALVDCCLAKNASDRPADGAALLGDMLRVHQGKMPSGKPVNSRPTTKGLSRVRGERGTRGLQPTGPKAGGRAVERTSRVPLIAGLAVLVVLVGLIVGTVFSGNDRQESPRLADANPDQQQEAARDDAQQQAIDASDMVSNYRDETLTEASGDEPNSREIDRSLSSDVVPVTEGWPQGEQELGTTGGPSRKELGRSSGPTQSTAETAQLEESNVEPGGSDAARNPRTSAASTDTDDQQAAVQTNITEHAGTSEMVARPPSGKVESSVGDAAGPLPGERDEAVSAQAAGEVGVEETDKAEVEIDREQFVVDLRNRLMNAPGCLGKKVGPLTVRKIDEEGLSLEARMPGGAMSMRKAWSRVTADEYAQMSRNGGLDDSATHLALVLLYQDSENMRKAREHLGDVLDPEYDAIKATLAKSVNLRPDSAASGVTDGDQAEGNSRMALLRRNGGDANTERAVAAGLAWLARNQEKDGSWLVRRHNGTYPDELATGITGLALLAFLHAGNTHKQGPYADNVALAVRYLLGRQAKDGGIGKNDGTDYREGGGYNHAIGALALTEAWRLARVPGTDTAAANAVTYSVMVHQRENHGWRYRPKSSGDLSVSAWFIAQLKSAEAVQLEVPPSAWEGAERMLDLVEQQDVYKGQRGGLYGYDSVGRTNWTTPSRKARICSVGIVSRLRMGATPDQLRGGLELLKDNLPDATLEPLYYYWYYGTHAMFLSGGRDWDTWNRQMKRALLSLRANRLGHPDYGSWPPEGKYGRCAGRAYVTAMSVLTLQVYYAYPDR